MVGCAFDNVKKVRLFALVPTSELYERAYLFLQFDDNEMLRRQICSESERNLPVHAHLVLLYS